MRSRRTITRRQALAGAGAAGLAAVGGRVALPQLLNELGSGAALAAAGCTTLTPTMTEGPYWIDEMLHRANVKANTPGRRANPAPSRAAYRCR